MIISLVLWSWYSWAKIPTVTLFQPNGLIPTLLFSVEIFQHMALGIYVPEQELTSWQSISIHSWGVGGRNQRENKWKLLIGKFLAPRKYFYQVILAGSRWKSVLSDRHKIPHGTKSSVLKYKMKAGLSWHSLFFPIGPAMVPMLATQPTLWPGTSCRRSEPDISVSTIVQM